MDEQQPKPKAIAAEGKATHGGARAGSGPKPGTRWAGRKVDPLAVKFMLRLSQRDWERLQLKADLLGVTPAALARKWIGEHLD